MIWWLCIFGEKYLCCNRSKNRILNLIQLTNIIYTPCTPFRFFDEKKCLAIFDSRVFPHVNFAWLVFQFGYHPILIIKLIFSACSDPNIQRASPFTAFKMGYEVKFPPRCYSWWNKWQLKPLSLGNYGSFLTEERKWRRQAFIWRKQIAWSNHLTFAGWFGLGLTGVPKEIESFAIAVACDALELHLKLHADWKETKLASYPKKSRQAGFLPQEVATWCTRLQWH